MLAGRRAGSILQIEITGNNRLCVLQRADHG